MNASLSTYRRSRGLRGSVLRLAHLAVVAAVLSLTTSPTTDSVLAFLAIDGVIEVRAITP
ncbi:MAG: hypothetical protein ACXWZG_02875 [Microbacterium sp.]